MVRKADGDRTSDSVKLQIDENLRHVYHETLQQDVPERFKLLLQKLREKGTQA